MNLFNFFQTSCFTSEVTDILYWFTTNLELTKNDNLRDKWWVNRENLLDTNTIKSCTNGNHLWKWSVSFMRYNQTTEDLNTLFITVFDFLVNFNFLTSLYNWKICLERCTILSSLDSGDKCRIHNFIFKLAGLYDRCQKKQIFFRNKIGIEKRFASYCKNEVCLYYNHQKKFLSVKTYFYGISLHQSARFYWIHSPYFMYSYYYRNLFFWWI